MYQGLTIYIELKITTIYALNNFYNEAGLIAIAALLCFGIIDLIQFATGLAAELAILGITPLWRVIRGGHEPKQNTLLSYNSHETQLMKVYSPIRAMIVRINKKFRVRLPFN